MVNTHRFVLLALLAPALAVAGCAQSQMGPTVQVVPGPHKNFNAFREDAAYCQQYSNEQTAGQAQAVNSQAVGGALLATVLGTGLGAAVGGGRGAAVGAATGAALGAGGAASASGSAQGGIQYQFDNAYGQCMYSKGNQVAGFPPPQEYGAGPGGRVAMQDVDPQLVRAVQAELIRLNYLDGASDGQLGGKTTSAIRAYERNAGQRVNGAVSQRLLAQLQSTPNSAAAAAQSQPASGWVAPGSSASAPPATSGWVSPVAAQ